MFRFNSIQFMYADPVFERSMLVVIVVVLLLLLVLVYVCKRENTKRCNGMKWKVCFGNVWLIWQQMNHNWNRTTETISLSQAPIWTISIVYTPHKHNININEKLKFCTSWNVHCILCARTHPHTDRKMRCIE